MKAEYKDILEKGIWHPSEKDYKTMRTETMHNLTLINGDCMDYMNSCEDNAFDLAIVDPPYGITTWSASGNHSISKEDIDKLKKWDSLPSDKYFNELFRVSKAAIVWGGNHFLDYLGKATTVIIWDKKNRDCHFSDAEIAWTNIKKGKVTIFDKYTKESGNKIHPTQKPIILYEWLLGNYAKPDQKILDTHLGSGSSAIAAHYFGCEFVGIEIDKDYFDASVERITEQTKQMGLS